MASLIVRSEEDLGCNNRQGFLHELEFVQALANPHMLSCGLPPPPPPPRVPCAVANPARRTASRA